MNPFVLAIIIVVGIILLFAATYFILGFHFYKISVSRNAFVGKLVVRHIEKDPTKYSIDKSWWDRQRQEEITIKNDGLNLYAALIRAKSSQSNKVAILVHGYCVSHKEMNAPAEMFLRNGFNVLAPDLRAHGKSDGKTIGMGCFDKYDVVLWIKKCIELFGEKVKIVLFGISMGGATVCLASAENLPKNVKCVISDCSYDNAYNQFEYLIKEKLHLPRLTTIEIANTFIKLIGKYDLKDCDPLGAVKKTTLPIFFIHGTQDEFVPFHMAKNLYDACDKKKCQLYLVEKAGHAQNYTIDPNEYEKRVIYFININLN